jgi:hypothetical protein
MSSPAFIVNVLVVWENNEEEKKPAAIQQQRFFLDSLCSIDQIFYT